MHQLSPQESFPIVYAIADPNDTATYYVRSVMRNSATGTIIKINGANFVNLTSQGSGRFTRTIQAPNDSSGLGTWVDITTKVYTDSGYTTLSDGYAQQVDKYLVQQRWGMALNGGGGGGYGFDPKQLKKLLLEVLEAFDFPKAPSLTPVLDELSVIKSAARKTFENGLSTLSEVQAIEAPKIDLFAEKIIATISKEIVRNKTPEFNPEVLLKQIALLPDQFPEIPDPLNYADDFENILKALKPLQDYVKNLSGDKERYFNDLMASVSQAVKSEKPVPINPPELSRKERLAKLKA